MEFVRSLADAEVFDRGYPGHKIHFLSQLESGIFFVVSVQEGGRAAGLHYHGYDQFYFILEGTMAARFDDEVRQIGPRSLVHVPAGLAHCHWNEGPGPELHLEFVIPAPPVLAPLAYPVSSAGDAALAAPRAGQATTAPLDEDRLAEGMPGTRIQALTDAGTGITSAVISYQEHEPVGGLPGFHVSQFDKYHYVREGELSADIGLQHYAAGPDNLIVVPGGVPHRLYNAGSTVARHIAIEAPALLDDSPRQRAVKFAAETDDLTDSTRSRAT